MKVTMMLPVACLMALVVTVTSNHGGYRNIGRPPVGNPQAQGSKTPTAALFEDVDRLSDRAILDRLEKLLIQGSAFEVNLIRGFVSTAQGQEMMKEFDPAVADAIRKLTNPTSTEREVAEAKSTLQRFINMMRSYRVSRSDRELIRRSYKNYVSYNLRQMPKMFIPKATLAELQEGFRLLAEKEKVRTFPGIQFGVLYNNLLVNGESVRQQVIDALFQWLDTADYQSLQKASQLFSNGYKPPTGVPPSTNP